jgi:hypothetical protein
MKSEKEKLAAKTVDQLKAAAKRLGGKLVTPDGKAKTKQQLINTIVMKQRLAGKSMSAKATTTTKKVTAKKTVAKKTTLGKVKKTLVIDNGRMTAIEAKKLLNYAGPTSFKATAHNKAAVKKEIDSILKNLRAQYNSALKPIK